MVQRLTISLDDDFAAAIDAFMARRGYTNRSEAIRDLCREALVRAAPQVDAGGHCVAAVSYLYDHHQRDLASRLHEALHDHHDIAVATLQTHLDHDHCLEVAVLKGPTAAVRRLAERAISERGVSYGQVNLVPMGHGTITHRHGPDGPVHSHPAPLL